MQPNSPPLSPSNISRFSSPCAIPDHLTAALLVLVNKPDTHFYPVFHIQKDPPPDITGVDTLGHKITAFDQIIMGSDVESDLRMFFAEPKHCSLIVDATGQLYVLNFSSGNPCLLNSATLTTNTLHPLMDKDVIHVAGKDFRVEYKSGYPLPCVEATQEDTTTQLTDTIEPPPDFAVPSPSSSPKEDKPEDNSYSLPEITATPPPVKSGTVPLDTTDNSLASMEVNTSQPSLVARDMSTTMDVSLPEKRRVSDPPKKAIQSPIKLKRKSAPIIHYRSINQSMDAANESPSPRRSSRQIPLRSPTPPIKRTSPRLSAGTLTPKQFPSTFKHPHSTGNSYRKSLGSRKSVRFGPSLSPEEFSRDMPPSTPVKRGGTPTPKSATKAVLRRSTPYKVPIPLSGQRAKRATKSISSSPEDSLVKTPKFSLSFSPKPRTPKSLQILSPVKEVPVPVNPSRPLAVDKPRLRRGFASGVISEMVESHTFKLSSRISTPTSLHSKQPVRLLDKGTPTGTHSRRATNLVTSQSFAPKTADLSAQQKRNSKSPEALLVKQTPKRRSVSPGNQPGQKESPNILKRSPRLSKSPPPIHSNESGQSESQGVQRHSIRLSKSPITLLSPNPNNLSGELGSQGIQRQSIRLSKSPITLLSPNPNNLSGQSESPLSRTRSPRLSKSPVSDPLAPVPKPKSPSSHQSPNIQSDAKVLTPKFLSNSTPKLTSARTPVPSARTPVPSARTPVPYPKRDSIQIPRTHSVGDSLGSRRVSQRLSRSPDTFQSPVSSRPQSQVATPQQAKPYGLRSPADFYKSPAVNMKSPAVNMKSPAVNMKSPSVVTKSPAVNMKSPAVNMKSPAVNMKSPAVNMKSPAVVTKSPAVNTKSPAVNMKSPAVVTKSPADFYYTPAVIAKSPAGNSRSPAVVTKSPAGNTKSPAVNAKSPAVSTKSPAVNMKSPAVTKSPGVQRNSPRDRPRISAVLSSQTPVSIKPRVSSASTLSLSPSPLAPYSSPRRRGRSAGTPNPPRLAWVSPPIDPLSPVRSNTAILLREDAFNPRLFQTPKSRNRTSQAEANFSPSLFDTPKSPRGSKRSISAPYDTSPATHSESKRSKSLPISKDPRKKNTAVPEDTFCPYLFRSPRNKPVCTPHKPEDYFSPGMFRTPPTPQTSARGIKRPLSQRARKPTKLKRGPPRVSEISPLLIPDLSPPDSPVLRKRDMLKRGVNKDATSSPAKVVLISSPKATPVTHKLETSPFVISSDSPSPVPVRVTRSRNSKQNNVSPTKPAISSPLMIPTRTNSRSKDVKIQIPLPKEVKMKSLLFKEVKIQSPLPKDVKIQSPLPKEVKIQPPLPKEVIEIDLSPSRLRGNRVRYVRTTPILLKREVVPIAERRVSPQRDTRRVLRVRNDKIIAPAANPAKSILKTPSKRQVFSPAEPKIDIPVSPTVSKLHNLNKTDRARPTAVVFAAVPKLVSSLPKPPNRILRSHKGHLTRGNK